MNKLTLPTASASKRQDAIEQIIIRLHVKVGLDPQKLDFSDPDARLDELREIYASRNRVTCNTRWGAIRDIPGFINNIRKNEYSSEGLLEKINGSYLRKEKKRVNKRRKKKNNQDINRNKKRIKRLADYVVRICYQVSNTELIVDAADLMNRVNHLGVDEINHVEVIDVMDRPGSYTISSAQQALDDLQALNEKDMGYCIQQVNKRILRDKKSDEMGEELVSYLNEIGQPHGIDTDLIEFEVTPFHGSNCYFGVKIHIGANSFLFDTSGTFKQLKAALREEVKSQIDDIVTCPFCGTKYTRAVLMEDLYFKRFESCSCGAKVVVESSRQSRRDGWISPALESLWEEACRQTGSRRYKTKDIDEVFSNIYSMGTGTTNWEMWFLQYPWARKK